MKSALRAPFLIFLLAIFLGGLVYYGERLQQNAVWVEALGDLPESRLAERAFSFIADRSIQPPLLRLEQDGDANIGLKLESCESLWSASGRREAALRILCNTRYGATIRDDVEGWNASSHMLAVRDNRFQDDSCDGPQEDGDDAKRIYFPTGCKPPHWRIERKLAGGAVTNLRLLPTAAPPQSEFASVFAGDAGSQYQSDWATVDAGRDESAPYVARMELTRTKPYFLERAKPITVEVAARLRTLDVTYALDGKPRTLHVEVRSDVGKGDGAAEGMRVVWRRACAEAPASVQDRVNDLEQDAGRTDADVEAGDCSIEPPIGAGMPLAYEIALSFASSARAKSLRIDELTLGASPVVLPLAAVAAQKARDAKARAIKKGGRDNLLDSGFDYIANPFGHLAAHCPPEGQRWEETCEMKWVTREFHRKTPHASHVGISLLDSTTAMLDEQSGRISERAFDLGLTDIIGLDRSDFGALLWAVDRKGGGDVKLSISEQMQQAVEHVLYGGEGGCVRPGRRSRNDALCLKLKPGQNTATLVLMDADSARGEIRAVASWPSLPKHSNIWDLRGLEEAHGANEGMAWRQLTSAQRPGSTFKAVTAISAAEAATNQGDVFPLLDADRDNLRHLLTGAMPVFGSAGLNQGAFLGIAHCGGGAGRLDAVVGDAWWPGRAGRRVSGGTWCVHNAGGTAYDDEAELPGSGGCPSAGGPSRDKQMGLCEAIKYSSNLFFGGLARLLTLADPKRPTLALEDIAQRLSLPGQTCHSSKTIGGRACGYDLTRGWLDDFPSGRLRADPIQFDHRSGPEASRFPRDDVLSGFGDAQSATAVAMTTVYASLATGCITRPSLVPLPRGGDGRPTNPSADECSPAFPASAEFQRLLSLVRDGMHAVVARPGGTAFKRFARAGPLIDRVFAKTGTATYRARENTLDPRSPVGERFALWLVGWIEGDGRPGPLGHRLAFACNVTGGKNREVGAEYCAPAIRDLLLELSGSVTR